MATRRSLLDSCVPLPAWVLQPGGVELGCINDVAPGGADSKLALGGSGLNVATASVDYVLWQHGVAAGTTVVHSLVLAGDVEEGSNVYTIASATKYASGLTMGPYVDRISNSQFHWGFDHFLTKK